MSESLRAAAPLGILMLDTRFPRIVGDIGNAASFDFPVIFRRMDGIGSADAVTAHPDRPRVLAALRANAEALAAEGAVGLSTSCGFRFFKDRVRAKVQLNVRDVLENGRVQEIAINLEGSPDADRLLDPRQFIPSAWFDL